MDMKENKYSQLTKNTIIFAIGMFGSKILTFLIVPLYTYILSTEDYGNIDLFTTGAGLLLPFTTFVIYESIIRYLTPKEIDKNIAVSTNMLIFIIGITITFLGIPYYKYLFNNADFIICFVIYLITSSYNLIFSQYLRACGKAAAFSINGIIVTATTVFANLIFIFFLKLGAYGYLYSLILAQILAAIQATISGNVFAHLSYRYINKKCIIMLLKYCVPLIPNNLMWWLMNAGDKYIINYFMGSSANGIYALSLKIPTLLNLAYSIFMQAWQLAAIEKRSQEEQSDFYSNVFLAVSAFLIFCTSLIICIVKPIFILLIGENFISAWKYVPLLCISTIIGCLGIFLGVIYMIKKKSENIFITTLIGSLANILLNYILISKLGLYGVALGTAGGYLFVFFIRAKDAYKEIKMNFHLIRLSIAMAILFFQSIILINIDEKYIYLFEFGSFILLIYIFRIELCKFIHLLKLMKKKEV